MRYFKLLKAKKKPMLLKLVLAFLLRHLRFLSVLLALGGLAVFLSMDRFSSNVELQENALKVFIYHNKFQNNSYYNFILQEITSRVKYISDKLGISNERSGLDHDSKGKSTSYSSINRNLISFKLSSQERHTHALSVLKEIFERETELRAHLQKFVYFTRKEVEKKKTKKKDQIYPKAVYGANLYAVVPSLRPNSADCFVLVIALDLDLLKKEHFENSITLQVSATIINFIRYLKSVEWMSRDVLLLFTHNSYPYSAGLRWFLDEYEKGYTSIQRRGIIRNAIIIDTNKFLHRRAYMNVHNLMQKNKYVQNLNNMRNYMKHYERKERQEIYNEIFIDIVGLDGTLPNQDLVNSYIFICSAYKIPISLSTMWSTMYDFLINKGAERPHTAFLQYSIPAFTAALSSSDKTSRNLSLSDLGRSISELLQAESGVLSSLNLSYVFYFFTSKDFAVSSGIYLFPALLIAIVLPLWVIKSRHLKDLNMSFRSLIIIMFIPLSALPSYLMATSAEFNYAIFGENDENERNFYDYTPDCSQWNPAFFASYCLKALAWLKVLAYCYFLLAIVIYFYVCSFKKSRKNIYLMQKENRSKVSINTINQSVSLYKNLLDLGRFCFGSLILIPLAVYNISLCVFFIALLLPPLLMLKNFSFSTLKARNIFRFCYLYIFLIVLLFYLCPYNYPIVQSAKNSISSATRRIFLSAYDFLNEKFRELHYTPLSFLKWLSTGQMFDPVYAYSVWYPPLPFPFSASEISSINNKSQSIIVDEQQNLNIVNPVLLGIYRTARDTYCIGSAHFPVFWFGLSSFLFFFALILFLPWSGA